MLRFRHIVLDSNPLRAAGWPRLTADLENLLQLARFFKIPIYIPKAVELELQEFWKDGFRKRVEKLQSAIDTVKKSFPENRTLQELQPPRLDDLMKEQMERGKRIAAEWGIQEIGFTQDSAQKLFEMAAAKAPPFRQEGAGFKDAVIFFSIVDHFEQAAKMPLEGPVSVALVTADSDFNEGLLKQAQSRGVAITVFKDVPDLVKVLEHELKDAVKKLRDMDSGRARQALEEKLPEITEFIRNTLTIPRAALGVWGNAIEITGLEVTSIGEVRTTYLTQAPADEAPKISADINIRIHLTVERMDYAPEDPLRVGERQPASILAALAGGSGLRRVEEAADKTVELEATADLQNDRYENLKLSSVRLKGRYWGALQSALLGGPPPPGYSPM